MPPVPGNALTLAVGKQVAKGTPQATPTYKLRYTGGFGPVSRRNIINLAETDASRQEGDPVVVGSRVEGPSEHYVRPDEFALLAYLHLGQIATSGAGADKTHVSSATVSGSAPYATLYKALNVNALVDRYADCQLSQLTVRGGAEQPLNVALDWLGLSALHGQTDPVLVPVDQAPMVYPEVTITKGGSAAGIIDSFEITSNQNRSLIVGDTGLAAGDIAAGQFAVTGSLTILFESDADYRAFHTGTTGGTTPGTTIAYEPLQILVQRAANLSILFDLNDIALTSYDPPANTDGAPIRVGAEFRSKRQATLADVLEITTKNQVVSY